MLLWLLNSLNERRAGDEYGKYSQGLSESGLLSCPHKVRVCWIRGSCLGNPAEGYVGDSQARGCSLLRVDMGKCCSWDKLLCEPGFCQIRDSYASGLLSWAEGFAIPLD